LTIFVWHVPIFELLMRHTPTWSPAVRTGVALALLAGVVVLVERWVARPVGRMTGRLGPTPVGHRSDDRPLRLAVGPASPSPAPVRGPTRPDAAVPVAATVTRTDELDPWDDDLDWDGPVRD
jgi:peptidoglycan/LPS O-acetylase OafA/YrhL